MQAFFAARGYPHDLITRARLQEEEKQRADPLVTTPGSNFSAADPPPLVITYHPKNIAVCNIPLRNYSILWDNDTTKVTFDEPPLKAFRRAKNLKDLVHSSLPQVLQRQIGTLPCNRRDCRTCPFINSSDRITITQGQIKISGFFTCITSQLIYCISCRKCPGVVCLSGETGRRLGDRFRENLADVIKKKVALQVPAHFAGMDHLVEDMQVAVIRAGLPEQGKRSREEMRFIHNFGPLAPGGLNQDFSFT